MKKFRFLAIILSTLLFVACDNDDDDVENPITQTQKYFPLHVGNYWVYDVYNIDNGIEKKVQKQDTIKISEEIIAGGQTYYNVEIHDYSQRWRPYVTLRDSSGYLVTPTGRKFFSNTLFDTVINEYHNLVSPTDTLHSEYRKMRQVQEPLNTAFGDFNVLDIENEVLIPNRPNKFTHCYFAKNIGIVMKTYCYINQPATIWTEQRLVEYCIDGKKHSVR